MCYLCCCAVGVVCNVVLWVLCVMLLCCVVSVVSAVMLCCVVSVVCNVVL